MANTKEEILGDIQVWEAKIAAVREGLEQDGKVKPEGTDYSASTLQGVENEMAKVLADNTKKHDAFWFKIMMDSKERKEFPECPRTISSEVLEPFRKQIEQNHGQTLERLNERGGMSPQEIHCAAEHGGLEYFRRTNIDDAVRFIIKINTKEIS